MESRTQGSRLRKQKNFEAKAKDRPSLDQGHRRKCSPKKKNLQKFFSGDLKEKGLQKFFSIEKGLQKIFFRRSLLEETKKRSSQILRKVSGVFQRNINGSKIMLSSRTSSMPSTFSRGRITIIKSLIVSILIYKVSLVPCKIPKKIIQEVNRTIFQFIWGSRNE